MRINVPVMKFGVPSSNNRIYDRKTVEPTLITDSIRKSIDSGTWFGGAHPTSSPLSLAETTHRVISFLITDDGVTAELELISKDIITAVQAGVEMCGCPVMFGTIEPTKEGLDRVRLDYFERIDIKPKKEWGWS